MKSCAWREVRASWKQREMKWVKDLKQSIREMGWGEVKLEDVEKLSNFQLKEMVKSCAWREVRGHVGSRR